MKVLILSTLQDLHATSVAEHLKELDIDPDFFSYDKFLLNTEIDFRFGTDRSTASIKLADSKVVNFHEYDSIWLRRPGGLLIENHSYNWVRDIVVSETSAALHGTLNGLQCLWVNHPVRDYQCLFKLYQLSAASRVGLTIPDSLVTNDPNKVREFYESSGKQLVYKFISESSNLHFPAYEMPTGVPTSPLRESDLEHLEQVKTSPHLFQKRIPKSYEIRATVIGKKIFAFRIDSQEGEGKIDWRLDYTVPMSPCEMPDDVCNALLRLMTDLGLNYGAVDFCVTPEGEHYFLEVNCGGQFLWLEGKGIGLAKELALLLAGKSEPITRAPTSASAVYP